ncbi:MAG TPA: cytochrome c peroxidase [Ferruginibacter sp.]|nr:c-type cytochrome [Ferruginibacter sp.]HRO16893.1 cytochrome c peroxidase [Ferruginibacter sp.]HRQ21614.1 cytochrome c peroxidase [Ferruginibacter sp.]
MKKALTAVVFILLIVGVGGFYTQPELTQEALGKQLFHEKILSKDSTVSCASCHKPEFAFADTMAFSIGIGGKLTTRNTPSVLNMKNRPYYFWDGRAGTLEIQALMPISNPDEMGLPIAEAVERLNKNEYYRNQFLKVFNALPDSLNLAAALSAFEQTLETVDSKFDLWSYDEAKLSKSEERGRQLFISERSRCFDCHSMEDFTDDQFKNIGLYNGSTLTDKGRFNVTGDSADLGKFKTPGLRNVGVTAPYMHNGMFKTLEEVIEYYDNPSAFVQGSINIDPALQKPLGLTTREKRDLVAFLKTLTDRSHLK